MFLGLCSAVWRCVCAAFALGLVVARTPSYCSCVRLFGFAFFEARFAVDFVRAEVFCAVVLLALLAILLSFFSIPKIQLFIFLLRFGSLVFLLKFCLSTLGGSGGTFCYFVSGKSFHFSKIVC